MERVAQDTRQSCPVVSARGHALQRNNDLKPRAFQVILYRHENQTWTKNVT